MTFVDAKVRYVSLRTKKLSTSSWLFFDDFHHFQFREKEVATLKKIKKYKIYRRIGTLNLLTKTFCLKYFVNIDKLRTFADEKDQKIDINEERFIINRCNDADSGNSLWSAKMDTTGVS